MDKYNCPITEACKLTSDDRIAGSKACMEFIDKQNIIAELSENHHGNSGTIAIKALLDVMKKDEEVQC